MRFRNLAATAATLTAALAITLLFACEARADRFSAIMVHDDDGFVSEAKVYVHDGNYRVEPGESFEPILIGRRKDNVMYRIDRLSDEITEDIFRDSDLPILLAPPKTKSMLVVGEEAFEGIDCKKYEAVIRDEGSNEHKEYRWYEKFSGLPIKFQAEDESWSYYLKDIELGSQDMSLFETPGSASDEDEGEDEEEYDEGEDDGSYGDEDYEDMDDSGDYDNEYEDGEEE